MKSGAINEKKDTEYGYSSVNEKKEPTLATMQTELIRHIAEFANQLQISCTKRGQAGSQLQAAKHRRGAEVGRHYQGQRYPGMLATSRIETRM